MTTDDTGGAAETVPIHAPSLLRRMSCWVYEGMLLFAVVFMASYLFSSLTQTRHGLQNRLGQQIFIFLVLGIYFSWFWHKGQTLAMKTWHIRALDIHGQPLSKRRAWHVLFVANASAAPGGAKQIRQRGYPRPDANQQNCPPTAATPN